MQYKTLSTLPFSLEIQPKNMEKMDHYIKQIENLPPAPVVAVQLLDMFNDPDRDIDRIVEKISHDPALCAETIRKCNNGALPGIKPAGNIFDAIWHLGLYNSYTIVITLVGSQIMAMTKAKYQTQTTEIWKHSVSTALIASHLAQQIEMVEAIAFTGGILHDIGKLAMFQNKEVNYNNLQIQSQNYGYTLTDAEKQIIGFTHAEIGARLLHQWGLPENICHAIEYHHHLPVYAGKYQRLTAIIKAADCISHQIEDKTPASIEGKEALELAGIEEKNLPKIIEQLTKQINTAHHLAL